jgi:hypothetical protein
LQEFDLKPFKDYQIGPGILETVKGACYGRAGQLYRLHSYYKPSHWSEHRRVIHGYILADYNDKLIQTWVTGPSRKSYQVVYGCLPYLAWTEEHEVYVALHHQAPAEEH